MRDGKESKVTSEELVQDDAAFEPHSLLRRRGRADRLWRFVDPCPVRSRADQRIVFLAGAALRDEDFGYMRDDCIEDNISEKNPNFSELTVLYEAVRVLDAEYIGLAHYRRHFAKEGFSTLENVLINKEDSRFANVLSYEELETLIPSKKIILPKKRNYRVETIFSHYAHTHGEGHLLVAREVISRLCREYLRSFDKVMKSHSAER